MKSRRCPACNSPLKGLGIACEVCGAGAPALGAASPGVGLAVGWACTLASLVVPYLWLATKGVSLGAYAIGYVAYVGIANVITPSYDPHNMGIRGTHIDNPFTHEDDRNRSAKSWALLLYPGKLVVWTLRSTWAALGRSG